MDVLLLVNEYDPGPGWLCRICESLEIQDEAPSSCPECGAKAMRKIDAKAEMVRMAERDEGTIEIVDHNEFLESCGGVGCLVLFLTPEQYERGVRISGA